MTDTSFLSEGVERLRIDAAERQFSSPAPAPASEFDPFRVSIFETKFLVHVDAPAFLRQISDDDFSVRDGLRCIVQVKPIQGGDYIVTTPGSFFSRDEVEADLRKICIAF